MNGIYTFKEDDARRFARERGYQVSKNGNELVFKECPYCHGRTGDNKNKFFINLKTGQFNCFRASCKAKGNMITLARDFGLSLSKDVDAYYNRESWKKFKVLPSQRPRPKPEAVSYMETRGISREVTERYGLTVKKDDKNILVFPFMDEDGMQFIKYRKIDFDKSKDSCKEWCEKNCKPILFGMAQCNMDNKTLIMTEGQIDSLSVSECGYENAVSVPTGCNGFTWFPYCFDWLKNFNTLIVFGDYEKGRMTLLEDMKGRFDGIVKHVRYDDYRGCKDANEILLKFGKEAIAQCIENAEQVADKMHIDLADIKRVDASQLPRISSGFGKLDKVLGGLYLGQVVILTGERGLGKSTFGSQLMIEAIKQGNNAYIYSGELDGWQVRQWLDLQIAGDAHVNAIPNNFDSVDYVVDANVIPYMERWYRGKITIRDNSVAAEDESQTIDVIADGIRKYGAKVALIDNLLTAMDDDTSVDQYRQQTKAMKKLVALANSTNTLIVLVVHPRKSTGVNFGNDDVAGSSNITNLAHCVIRFSAPEEGQAGDRTISVYKNRNNGRTVQGIPVYYQAPSRRLSEDPYCFDMNLPWCEEFAEAIETPFDDDELILEDIEYADD